MRIFNLDFPNDECDIRIQDFDSGSPDIRVWDLDESCENGCNITIQDFDVGEDSQFDIKVYIPGPVGPIGPPGVSAQTFLIVTTSTLIPLDQIYTLVNALAPTTQTLPPLSTVISGDTTMAYTVTNLTSQNVAVVPSGLDEILVGNPVNEPFANTSFTFLATPLGWVII